MRRYEVSDDEWNRIEQLLPGRVGDAIGDTLLAVHRRPTIRQALVEVSS